MRILCPEKHSLALPSGEGPMEHLTDDRLYSMDGEMAVSVARWVEKAPSQVPRVPLVS